MKFNRLFTTITINGMTIKNRVSMPAMHLNYTPNGKANERFNEFYYKRAEGGVGLVIVGGIKFDEFGGTPNMPSLSDDSFISGYKEFTEGMHKRGAKVAAQLYHAGRYTRQKNLPAGELAYSSSAVFSPYSGETPKEMSKEEICKVIKDWAAAAARAKEAGFDAVEILGSAGYLICQFLSPTTNIRTDEYGGSFENRCRFPLEVIRAVREAVGDEYPLLMRISGNDFIKGSNTNVEATEFAKIIEKAGIDAINVTGGWHETRVPQLPGEVPRAGFAYLAASIKDCVKIPVIASNRINDPAVAEKILAFGMADMVNIGRGHMADPEWTIKAEEGRIDEIRRCVGCNQGCLAKTFFGMPAGCLVNGFAGRELEIDIKDAPVSKNILVVGGGPAGTEFAIAAKDRGHNVTIWEKENKLGGQLHLVATPPGKSEFRTFISYEENMVKKKDVNIVLNKKATVEDIEEAGFNEVVIATGVRPNIIPVPLSDKVTVITSNDVLSNKAIPGRNVLVVGGGAVGCETALYLADDASMTAEELKFLLTQNAETSEKISGLLNTTRRNVTIIDIAPKIGSGFDPGTSWPAFKEMKRLGVKQFASTKILDIKDDIVMLENQDKEGKLTKIELIADTIVLAVGSRPENELYMELVNRGQNVHIIGDASKVGKVIDAVRDGATLGNTI